MILTVISLLNLGDVMSKERELLVRIYRFLKSNVKDDSGLGSDIRELLTQHEHTKEREVSGKIISTDDACNWNLTVAALKDYDHVYVNGIRYTEYQPEQTEQEPLSEATINYYLERLGSHFKWDDGFEAGVKWAEKAHGIGVDE